MTITSPRETYRSEEDLCGGRSLYYLFASVCPKVWSSICFSSGTLLKADFQPGLAPGAIRIEPFQGSLQIIGAVFD